MVFGVILGGLSAIGGALATFCSTIGGALGTAISTIGIALAKLTPELINAVSNLITAVSQIFDILTKDEKPEEIGLKASLSDRKPEDFDSTLEYIQHLRSMQLSPEDLEKLNDEKMKDVYKIGGMAIQINGINEKIGMDLNIGDYVKFAEIGIKTGEQVKEIIEKFKEKDVEPNINDAIEGNLDIEEASDIIQTLKEGVLEIEDNNEIWKQLNEMLGA
nr:hypothetical protein [Fusobacterium gastrosuis]